MREFIKTICYCAHFSWKSSKRFTFLSFVSQLSTPLVIVSSSWVIKQMMDVMLSESTQTQKLTSLLLFSVVILCLYLINTVSLKFGQYWREMNDLIILQRLEELVMIKSLTVDIENFDNPRYYDKLQFAASNTGAILQIMWNVLIMFGAIVSLLGVYMLLGIHGFTYGFIMMLVSLPLAFVGSSYTKKVYKLHVEQIGLSREKSYYQALCIEKDYSQEIRLLNLEDYIVLHCRALFNRLFIRSKQVLYSRAFVGTITDFFPDIARTFIGFYIGYRIITRDDSLSLFPYYTALISQLGVAIQSLVSSSIHLYDNQLRIKSIHEFENLETFVRDNGKIILTEVKSIEFRNVNFTYPGSDQPTICQVSFRVVSPEKVALIGANASGKSTIIKLMMRFYDVDSGQILINDRQITDYTIRSLRDSFCVYFQLSKNYSWGLFDNVRAGDFYFDSSSDFVQSILIRSGLQELLQRISNPETVCVTRFLK